MLREVSKDWSALKLNTNTPKKEITDYIQKERIANFESLIYFTQLFYRLRTGRKFELSNPLGRESHYITIAHELIEVIKGNTKRLLINVPPRYGKSELLIHFVAWAMAQFPDSNFLYVSYAHMLASIQTQTIRSIMMLNEYRDLFNIGLKSDSTAKDNFKTSYEGTVYAAGAGGTITGLGAGIKECDRFGGAVVIDDIHKPNDIHSDIIRQSVIDWYDQTLLSRLNDPVNTPIICLGQRLHEDDLIAKLIKSNEWKCVILPAIDEAGNALHPKMHDINALKKMSHDQPYVYASQYQQNPIPAGGTIFKSDWFKLLDNEPEIISTFITVDSAETDKSYNDATVFSFWGLYQVVTSGIPIDDLYALHWIDCREMRIEAADLEQELITFYTGCMRHKVQPKFIAIEKKSTGVTLAGALKRIQGLSILEVLRTSASGSKTTRFIEMQEYIAKGLVSLPTYGRHVSTVMKHMESITANDTHAFDDIADTAYDAVKIALIDRSARLFVSKEKLEQTHILAKQVMASQSKFLQLRRDRKR